MTQAVSGQQIHKVTLTPYDTGGEWTTTHKVTLTLYDTGGEWTTTHKVTLTPYDTGGEWTSNTLTSYYTDGKCHNKNQTIKNKNNRVRLRCVHGSLTKCGVTFRLTYHQLALPPFSYLETSLHKS